MTGSSHPSFHDVMVSRYNRREMLGTVGKLGVGAALATLIKPQRALAETAAQGSSATLTSLNTPLSFAEIAKSTSANHDIASGYRLQVLLRWGDKVLKDAPEFKPHEQTPEAQSGQLGFNSDFLAFMPLPYGSNNSEHGLLCINHEHTYTRMMFSGMNFYNAPFRVNKEQVDIEQMAHGHTVIEIRKNKKDNTWETDAAGKYNRRYNAADTAFKITGPAAGHPRLRTNANPQGNEVIGTFANCAGGVTPWGSVLFCEENIDYYFVGDYSDTPEAKNHKRIGIGNESRFGWHRFYDRFNVGKELHEPNRFGWVIEYDPYNPDRQPVKRTALGRFAHETATCTLAPDGRVVIYSGDDGYFEYLYRFVTRDKYDPENREKNFGLLDHGELCVAKFNEDGSLEWLPLIQGVGALTPENGFHSQADVVIEARRAGDLVGGTKMDRPEGIAIHPHTGQVYVSLTYNYKRKPEEVNPANTRPYNFYGQIVELLPPDKDHAAKVYGWTMFLRGGDPKWEEDGAYYASPVTENGWLACPDNLAFDPAGRLWVGTDSQPKFIDRNDSLYAVETSGERRGATRLFFNCPSGAEVTGPCFTPDGETLFLSVQAPGDNIFTYATFETPNSRWPDFRDDVPPRPSVIAITKKGGGIIGS